MTRHAVAASEVQFSLGSDWVEVPTTSQTYSFSDDLTNKVLTTRVETPPPNPLGFTNFMIGPCSPKTLSRPALCGAHS